MIERKNPLLETATSEVVLAGAHNNIDSVRNCPACGALMQTVRAAGHAAYVCTTHRICLPKEDDNVQNP